ncbi:MAG: cytochrome c biogenesis protein CcsA [Gemmatimonadaceae bacterium]|nr:cytochrome c biogenesis protein CcsA [Gemmatimonadaceae bacterium]
MTMHSIAHADPIATPSARWAWFGIFALLFLVFAQVTAVMISVPDRDMGHLQKIMYVHVPAAWTTFLAFFVVAICSLRVLFRGGERDDLLAASAAEVGAVFNALTLALGMMWGRPTWGVWWTWDARLTSTLVLLLIFIGYLSLRAFVDDPERRATWSAAVGVLGAINVPIVYMSVRWWRTLHQVQSAPSTLDPAYTLGLRLNAFAFLFVLIFLIRRRYEAAALLRAAEHADDARALGGR